MPKGISLSYIGTRRVEAARKGAAARKRAKAARAAALGEALEGGAPVMTPAEHKALQGTQRDRVMDGEKLAAILARVRAAAARNA